MKKTFCFILLALFFLPAGAALIHQKIHTAIVWLSWLGWFDAIIVTLMFKSRKTAVFALFLNSIFVIAGVGYHLQFLPGGWADIMVSLTDLFLGFAAYRLVTKFKV